MNGTVQRRADLLATEVEDTLVVLDFDTGDYFELNDTAAAVWAGIEAPVTVDALAGDLAAAYGADPAQVREDVAAILATFAAEGLLAGRAP